MTQSKNCLAISVHKMNLPSPDGQKHVEIGMTENIIQENIFHDEVIFQCFLLGNIL